MKNIGIIFLTLLFLTTNDIQAHESRKGKRYTIMGLSDSITEGGDYFQCYLFPLWEKLLTGGYAFDFVGPRLSKCRIGTLNHAGFSGQHAEYLDKVIDTLYTNHPADIVLLHTGHNHFDTEKPVAGIVAAQQSIIRKIKRINPEATILVAQVITSGKLPKYSYIPELNRALADMITQLNDPKVILVDQATGFDWQKHTIDDMVHPNAEGAGHMAGVWYEALQKIMQSSIEPYSPDKATYKKVAGENLQMHIFRKQNGEQKQPAIVFFFGGGWQLGTPLQFYKECAYYAEKGMVAVTVDYRISYLHQTTPFESFDDAKDAVCWLRNHADTYGIDTAKIAVAGASAGGHLAAALGTISDKNKNCIYQPNLMLLYYPVVDNSGNGYGTEEMKNRLAEISPMHNVRKGTPPALFILGDRDHLIPVATGKEFTSQLSSVGTDCELHILKGAGHPVFQYRKELNTFFYDIRDITDRFLLRHNYLKN